MVDRYLIRVLACVVICASGFSETYSVSPDGSDSNPGTKQKPFKSIGKAASVMKAGDTCYIYPGIYRESVVLRERGTAENPIRFVGAKDKNGNPLVTINGTDVLTANWSKIRVNGIRVYSGRLPEAPGQLFLKGKMMTEARWPDQPFSRIWDRSTWAKSAKGAKKDLMVSSELAATGVDWTGALATLNVGHQYKTWTRTVLEHQKGSAEFRYELGERLGDGKDDGRTWWDDRFYLSGKVEALTSPEEWFYDNTRKRLLFIPPRGRKPGRGEVSCKVRDFGFSGRNVSHVEISDLNFFGCTFSFQASDYLTIENCRVLFPNYAPVLTDTFPQGRNKQLPQTRISGDHNTLRKISVAYGNTSGIKLAGSNNRLENSIVHDVCWAGSILHSAVWINSSNGEPCNSTVSRCTVYNSGNIGIWFLGQNNVVEYNHVYNTGLACKDIAAIHTGGATAAGSVACYNWVHDSRGKGMRGDDQTRSLTFHHNVIWDCDEGMIVKGDFNRCYNNTILGSDGHGCLIIPTRAEPRKWWAKYKFLDVQNSNSIFCNNLVEVVAYRHDPLPDNKDISHNIELQGDPVLKQMIAASERQEFLPPRSVALVDAGRMVPGSNVPITGKAPDIGAYEFGGETWRPGADWQDPSIGVELLIDAEVARSWALPKAH